jgi:hypothetical protein
MKKLAKKQTGGMPAPNKTVKLREDNKNYVTKIKTDDKGNVSSIKVRRTVKGLLTGAPSPKKVDKQAASGTMKYGGTSKMKVSNLKKK